MKYIPVGNNTELAQIGKLFGQIADANKSATEMLQSTKLHAFEGSIVKQIRCELF